MNRKPHSEETKAKISKALKGRKGVSPSAETRAKIGIAGRGRIASEETRRRLSAANKGRVFSAEVRKKMSDGIAFWHTPEERAARAARVLEERRDPRWMKGVDHLAAVDALLVSPSGVLYSCRNISHFVRENAQLFDEADIVWSGRHSNHCRAAFGLQSCRRWLYETDEKKLKKLGRTWKGWSARLPP